MLEEQSRSNAEVTNHLELILKLNSTNNTGVQYNAEERTPVRTYAVRERHQVTFNEIDGAQYNAEERTPVRTYAAEDAAGYLQEQLLSCNGILG